MKTFAILITALVIGLIAGAPAPLPPLILVTGTIYNDAGAVAPGTQVVFTSLATQVVGGVEVPPTTFNSIADHNGAISVTLPQGLRVNVAVGKGAPLTVTLPSQASIDLSALLAAVQIPPPANLITSLTAGSGGDFNLSISNPVGAGAAAITPGSVTHFSLLANSDLGGFALTNAGNITSKPTGGPYIVSGFNNDFIHNVMAYGAKCDGPTDDTAAFNNCATSFSALGGTCEVPSTAAGCLLTTAVVVPPQVSFVGASQREASLVRVSGAHEGFTAISARGNYALGGNFRNLKLSGDALATVGVHIQNRQLFSIDNVSITGFAQQCLVLDAVLSSSVDNTYIAGCGNPSTPEVSITGQQNTGGNNVTTTIASNNLRIDAGNSGVMAGLAIDRTGGATFIDLTSESDGTPIVIGGQPENIYGAYNIAFINPDLENASDFGATNCTSNGVPYQWCTGSGTANRAHTGHYVEVGFGWTGAAFSAAQNIKFIGGTSQTSSATGTSVGIALKNTQGTLIDNLTNLALNTFAGTPTSYDLWLDGTGNIDTWVTPGQRSGSLAPGIWEVLAVNGVKQRINSRTGWNQNGTYVSLFRGTEFATVQSGSILDCGGTSNIPIVNAGSTTLTNALNGGAGGVEPDNGQLLTIEANDTATTIKNLAGGNGQFCNGGGNDIVTQGLSQYLYVYNTGNHCFRQVNVLPLNNHPAATGSYSMGSNKLIGLAPPSLSGDALSWGNRVSAKSLDTPLNSLSASGNTTCDFSLSNVCNLTLTGNVTLTMSNAAAGELCILKLTQDSSGGRTVTFPAAAKFPGGVAPTVTSAATKTDVITFISDGSSFFASSLEQNM